MSCNLDGSQKGPYPVRPLMHGDVQASHSALLASASLIVLAALGAPDAASAACNDKNQTFSSSTPGPISSTGGNITIDAGASVAGGPTGVYRAALRDRRAQQQGLDRGPRPALRAAQAVLGCRPTRAGRSTF